MRRELNLPSRAELEGLRLTANSRREFFALDLMEIMLDIAELEEKAWWLNLDKEIRNELWNAIECLEKAMDMLKAKA